MKRELRSGYTTGACAAAASKGAAVMLREQRLVEQAEIELPAGERVSFTLHGQQFSTSAASCFVVKDAGDDPDVTNGAEIHARITLTPAASGGGRGGGVVIEGGAGIGRVTKPGLAVPVGEWAINPVPRRMITDAIDEVFSVPHAPFTLHCQLSIPNGEQLALKTLNARLGIIGGLSILGTTGIVKPVSARAWTDTIDAAIDVAVACDCRTIVFSTGRTSELVTQKFFRRATSGTPGNPLPEEAFVMMGDHVGHALRSASQRKVGTVIIAGQFAKMLKIACGHEQTHVSSSELDLSTLAGWVERETGDTEMGGMILQANTAREVIGHTSRQSVLSGLVCSKVKDVAQRVAAGVEVKVLLAGYGGEVLYFA